MKQTGSQRVKAQTEHGLGRASRKAAWRRWDKALHRYVKLCEPEGVRARLGTLNVCVWHGCVCHGVSAGVMTELLGHQGLAWGWRVAWGPGDDRLVPGCPRLAVS